MKLFLSISLLVMSFTSMCSQTKISVGDAIPVKEYENTLVKKIYSDIHTSTFVILIKKGVKPHKHIKHTEQVFVLEGKAQVQLNDQKMIVQKGDWITIPEQSIHSVTVLSEIPLKVISVQTPEFKGEDRVFIE